MVELNTGRTKQKARTRRALLEAARRLMDKGETVSVDSAAVETGISRTTAYRYFADADTLMLEAALDQQFATPEEVVGDCTDVRARVHNVQRYLFAAIRQAESRYRLFLSRALSASISQDEQGRREIRGGRRLPMYEHALEPIRSQISRENFDFVVLSLSAASGLESYLALKDVCQVDDAVADSVVTSNVEAILDRLLPREK